MPFHSESTTRSNTGAVAVTVVGDYIPPFLRLFLDRSGELASLAGRVRTLSPGPALGAF